MKARQATNDRRVFRKPLVAMKLDEVFKQPLDQIECVRPVGMTRELHALKRGLCSTGFGGSGSTLLFFILRHVMSCVLFAADLLLSDAGVSVCLLQADAAAQFFQRLLQFATPPHPQRIVWFDPHNRSFHRSRPRTPLHSRPDSHSAK